MSVRSQFAILAKAGIQAIFLDSGFHRNDALGSMATLCCGAELYFEYAVNIVAEYLKGREEEPIWLG